VEWRRIGPYRLSKFRKMTNEYVASRACPHGSRMPSEYEKSMKRNAKHNMRKAQAGEDARVTARRMKRGRTPRPRIASPVFCVLRFEFSPSRGSGDRMLAHGVAVGSHSTPTRQAPAGAQENSREQFQRPYRGLTFWGASPETHGYTVG